MELTLQIDQEKVKAGGGGCCAPFTHVTHPPNGSGGQIKLVKCQTLPLSSPHPWETELSI
jgi:hypothetical protein